MVCAFVLFINPKNSKLKLNRQLCVKYEANFDLNLPSFFSETYGQGKLTTSSLQSSVSAFCRQVGFSHVEEHILSQNDKDLPGRNFLSIDLANVERKIGIEVDGPAHFINIIDDEALEMKKREDTGDFIVDRQREFTRLEGFKDASGATFMKHRLLIHEGWNIVHVPFFIWTKLMTDDEKRRYITDDVMGEFI